MMAVVTERRTEIGLRKALGAQPGQIQLQFLIESFLLSILGGLVGMVSGIGLSALICRLMDVAFVFSSFAVILGVGFSAGVGIVFGWMPARKASGLSPIEALRSV
jgi:putative ABC transport system permease protein